MDYDKKLSDLKKTLLGLIKKAVIQNNSSEIVIHSKFLEEVEKLIQRTQDIANRIVDIEKRIGQGKKEISPAEKKATVGEPKIDHISAKAKGKIRRENFLKLLNEKGIYLKQKKGIIYHSEDSKRIVGIASASEREDGNRWFLGLPPENYDTIVLLCEKADNRVYSIILPSDFVNEHLDKFSRDSNKQIKFNILKDNKKFLLIIPGLGNVDVSIYLDRYEKI